MTWLNNSWYQAAWADEVPQDAALARTILDQPLLFFRTLNGAVASVLDRCPHRFAPLSRGRVQKGVVTCGYHGLAFDGSGACVHNPHGPLTSAMRVQSYPVVERHSAIWVWMGDPDAVDPGKIPDLSFIDATPETARIKGYLPTAANYQLLADNILDLSHADYLHPATLGGMMTASKAKTYERDGQVIAEWFAEACDPPAAFQLTVHPPSKADIWLEVTWSPAALMVLRIAALPTGVPRSPADDTFTLHNMTPETATATHYFFCNTRRFLVEDVELTAAMRAGITQAFTAEDKPMIEAQQTRMRTDNLWGLKPLLLPIDAGSVRARRELDRLIKAEEASLSHAHDVIG